MGEWCKSCLALLEYQAEIANGPDIKDEEDVEVEIAELERRLQRAKARRKASPHHTTMRPWKRARSSPPPSPSPPPPNPSPLPPISTPHLPSTTHFLLLLSDSALPLGSFAFSSGLESFLAHARSAALTFSLPPPRGGGGPSSHSFSPSTAFLTAFLPLSVSAYASSALPFVLAAHRDPAALPALDDALDAAVVCAVGRRASVAQGRALLGVWERAFSCSPGEATAAAGGGNALAAEHIARFSALLKTTTTTTTTSSNSKKDDDRRRSKNDEDDEDDEDDDPDLILPPASAHLAPLFGAVSRALGLGADQTAYVFLLGHARAVVSAAVRAGVMGPYQAQRVLAGADLRGLLARAVAREWHTPAEEAGQTVPVMDLWAGRHELLYSRIFNS